MRVAARRLRVALPLLARKPQGKRVRSARRLLQALTREGGRSRDLDVMSRMLAEICQERPAPELQALLHELRAARSRARRRLAGVLLDVDLKRLRRDLAVIQERGGESLFVVLGRLRQVMEGQRDAAVKELVNTGKAFDPEALHRLRIRFRRLRYVAEVADALRGRASGAPELLREVQESVGNLHDCWVLGAWLGRRADRARARGHRARTQTAALEQAHALEAARRHHSDLLARDLRALLGQSIEAILAPRAA